MIRGVDPTIGEGELDLLIASWMARQIVRSRFCAPNFLAVMDESALRRRVGGPGVMKRQLQHLLSVNTGWP